MADEIVLEFAVLNIVADPHREGVYPSLLRKIAHIPVQLWGDDYLAFTPPRRDAEIWTGRIFVWTELDPNAPAINTKILEELSLEAANVSVPENIGINGRIFNYVLREKDHKLFFETKNEFGRHLSPYRLLKPIDRLFYKTNTNGEMTVTVTVYPEDDALNNILKIKFLNTLEIHLRKPNPDDNDVEAEDILRELEEQGASKKDIKITAKSRKKGITPNHRTRIEAEVAAENGYVRGTGKNGAGEVQDLSTEEYPKIVRVPLAGFASVLSAAKSVARNTVLRLRGRRA